MPKRYEIYLRITGRGVCYTGVLFDELSDAKKYVNSKWCRSYARGHYGIHDHANGERIEDV